MNLAPGGIELSFEVTFDIDSLNVGMSVYDTTGDVPNLVQGPLAMVLVAGATYVGKFTGLNGRSYVILKAVYTDGTFTTLSPNYSQGSESIVVQDVGGGSSSGGTIVGYVLNNNPVVGFVTC